MERVSRGDVQAFECVLERYWSGTLLYARQLTYDPEQASDVTQEAFVRLWERRSKWVASGSVRLWLLKTVRNLIITEQRKGKVRSIWAARVRAGESATPPSPLEETANHELHEAINVALRELSPRRREALTLFHLQGLSYREVAEIMNVRAQTAANYVQAAIGELRISLAHFLQPQAEHEGTGNARSRIHE